MLYAVKLNSAWVAPSFFAEPHNFLFGGKKKELGGILQSKESFLKGRILR